jgi:hypothetical protein
MTAAAPTRPSHAAATTSLFFWIKRDRSQHMRLLTGSISVTVPMDQHSRVLGTDFEDWAFDFLREGVLGEWQGLDLVFHFATIHDSIMFALAWL